VYGRQLAKKTPRSTEIGPEGEQTVTLQRLMSVLSAGSSTPC
jgi:hypothetical protein